MSFSSDVKEELSKQLSTARHCQIAEIAAIISNVRRYSYLKRRQILPEDSDRKFVCGQESTLHY